MRQKIVRDYFFSLIEMNSMGRTPKMSNHFCLILCAYFIVFCFFLNWIYIFAALLTLFCIHIMHVQIVSPFSLSWNKNCPHFSHLNSRRSIEMILFMIFHMNLQKNFTNKLSETYQTHIFFFTVAGYTHQLYIFSDSVVHCTFERGMNDFFHDFERIYVLTWKLPEWCHVVRNLPIVVLYFFWNVSWMRGYLVTNGWNLPSKSIPFLLTNM